MKIHLLCYRGNPYCGGQGVYLYYLSRELARRGHEVTVFVGPPYPRPMPWARTIYVENLNLWGVRRNFLPPASPWKILRPLHFLEFAVTRLGFFPEMLTFSLRLLPILLNPVHGAGVHILHDVQSLGYGLLLLKRLAHSLLTTVHHPLTIDFQSSLERNQNFWEKYYTVVFYPLGMHRRVIRFCDRVLTSSRESADAIQRSFGVPKARLRMVYNGVDTDFFQPFRRERIPNRLLFVGNTDDYKKGIIQLFKAMALLPSEITLTIVDDGLPNKNYAYRIAQKMDLSPRVEFTGKVSPERLRDLYLCCQAVVLPSIYEGFGLPAAEAMACGTPVVATRAGALPEVIGEDGAGILVPPRSPVAMAQAIREVLSHQTDRQRMGAIGRERVLSLFSWERVARRTEEVYKELMP